MPDTMTPIKTYTRESVTRQWLAFYKSLLSPSTPRGGEGVKT